MISERLQVAEGNANANHFEVQDAHQHSSKFSNNSTNPNIHYPHTQGSPLKRKIQDVQSARLYHAPTMSPEQKNQSYQQAKRQAFSYKQESQSNKNSTASHQANLQSFKDCLESIQQRDNALKQERKIKRASKQLEEVLLPQERRGKGQINQKIADDIEKNVVDIDNMNKLIYNKKFQSGQSKEPSLGKQPPHTKQQPVKASENIKNMSVEGDRVPTQKNQ